MRPTLHRWSLFQVLISSMLLNFTAHHSSRTTVSLEVFFLDCFMYVHQLTRSFNLTFSGSFCGEACSLTHCLSVSSFQVKRLSTIFGSQIKDLSFPENTFLLLFLLALLTKSPFPFSFPTNVRIRHINF